MDRERLVHRRHGWLMAVMALAVAGGCQTVKTPEEKIARSNMPTEFKKVSMPEYVVEPPDLIIVEVLEALPGRPVSGERLVKPDGKISLGFYGEVFVAGLTTEEIKEKLVLHLRKYLPDEVLGLTEIDPKDGSFKEIDPRESNRVFVDVTAYNSKFYYVQGDVAAPGKMPITGNETVLDAINYAGGLIPTKFRNPIATKKISAEPRNRNWLGAAGGAGGWPAPQSPRAAMVPALLSARRTAEGSVGLLADPAMQ